MYCSCAASTPRYTVLYSTAVGGAKEQSWCPASPDGAITLTSQPCLCTPYSPTPSGAMLQRGHPTAIELWPSRLPEMRRGEQTGKKNVASGWRDGDGDGQDVVYGNCFVFANPCLSSDVAVFCDIFTCRSGALQKYRNELTRQAAGCCRLCEKIYRPGAVGCGAETSRCGVV